MAIVGFALAALRRPLALQLGSGASFIVNGVGSVLGVPPHDLRLNASSVACILLGALGLLL